MEGSVLPVLFDPSEPVRSKTKVSMWEKGRCVCVCVYQRAEVLGLPQQPVLTQGVQSFLRHTVHWALRNLLRESAHHQEQLLADALLGSETKNHL